MQQKKLKFNEIINEMQTAAAIERRRRRRKKKLETIDTWNFLLLWLRARCVCWARHIHGTGSQMDTSQKKNKDNVCNIWKRLHDTRATACAHSQFFIYFLCSSWLLRCLYFGFSTWSWLMWWSPWTTCRISESCYQMFLFLSSFRTLLFFVRSSSSLGSSA